MTRPLLPRERALLDLLLSASFPGVEELRTQADTVLADGEALIIDLVIDPSMPSAAVLKRTPVHAVVDGDGYDGGVLLFVDDGALSALEYWWVTEDPPAEFPPLSAVGGPIVATP